MLPQVSQSMEQALRYLLPLYLLIFFGAVFVWRTWRVWRSTGVNAYLIWRKTGVEGFVGRCFRIMPAMSALVVLAYAWSPDSMRAFGEIPWLISPALQLIGIGLLLGSFAVIVLAQSQMGHAWRIGIDDSAPTQLVTAGLFSISRNPVFLGVMINTIGFFLVLPNAVTLLVLGLNAALISVQIRLEENHLEASNGDLYRHYATTTSRWWGRRRRRNPL